MALAATRIRDEIIKRLRLMNGPTVTGKRFTKIQKSPLPQFQPGDYPAVAVFILRSNDAPDGDGNEGNIKFISEPIIVMHFGRKGGPKDEADMDADDDADDALTLLLTDAEFTQLGKDALFESIEHIERSRTDPQEGDSYYSFVRVAITFRTRQEFMPVVTDPYRGATVTVKPLDPAAFPQGEYHWDEDQEDAP